MDQPRADMRASDRERQQAVRALRGELREGRLSDVTFVRRLFLALDARRRTELDDLMSDLPGRRPLRARLMPPALAPLYSRLVELVNRLVTRPSTRPSAGETRELTLPPVPGKYVIGRSDDVDLHLDDLSVSRRHALIAHTDGGWVLTDLGSRNGTWLNGWRLPGPAPVRSGDLLDVGSCRFVVVDRQQVVDGQQAVTPAPVAPLAR